MDTYEKNTAMRMLPYGVHILTAQAEEDQAIGAVEIMSNVVDGGRLSTM